MTDRMRLPAGLRSLFSALFHRSRFEDDMEEELRAHIEDRANDLRRSGISHLEAGRLARLEFGGYQKFKEECREATRTYFLETLLQDLRFAFRMLRKSPGFAALAILTLAIGIAANTAIFSVIEALLFRNLPIHDSGRVVLMISLREGYDPFGISLLEYSAFRNCGQCFESSGLGADRSFNLIDGADRERIEGAAVQAGYLPTLDIRPVLGQTITRAEDVPGGPPVALIGYGLWMRRFGGSPGIIGRALNLDGRNVTVIGVLPKSFNYPDEAEIWLPLQAPSGGLPLTEYARHSYDMVARLRPGVGIGQTAGELKRIALELQKQYPTVQRGWSVTAIPIRRQLLQDFSGRVQKSLFALLAGVGFLLLVCCANVGGLLMARGLARQGEISVRRALGASSSRVIRQLITESLLIALLGGGVGLAMSYSLLPLLGALSPIQPTAFGQLLKDLRLDWRAVLFATAITCTTGILSGLLPAFRTARTCAVNSLVREVSPRSGGARSSRRMLDSLVVAEMAMSLTLLTAGALMLQSFRKLRSLDVGFRPENLLTLHMELSPAKYGDFSRRISFAQNTLQQIQQIPGVVSAGITTNLPLTSFVARDAIFAVEGHPSTNPADVPIASYRLVSPQYLQTLGVSLIKGRLFNEGDRQNTQPVAVISEELARQGWHGEDPLGKHIKRIVPGQSDSAWVTVVGIVRNVKEDRGNFRIDRPVWYLPYAQHPNDYPLDLVIRSRQGPASLTSAIRNAVFSVDPDQPLSNVITMRDQLAGMLVTERFGALLMFAVASFGLLLAAIGLYGAMSYSVSQRTHEIGIRFALGSHPRDVLRLLLSHGTRLAAIGIAAGLVSAAVLARLIRSLLFGVSAGDPLTYLGVSVLLMIVTLAASYLPARRAMKVDPMVALRAE